MVTLNREAHTPPKVATSTGRTVLQIRCTQEEKTRWQTQAGSRTLSDYIKYLLLMDGREPASLGPYITTTPITRESLMSIASPTRTGGKSSYKPDWKVSPVKKGK